MMREHENRRVVRRIVAPPPLPGMVAPRTSHGSKHIASKNPGADIFKRLRGKIIVDAWMPAGLAVRLLEHLGILKPPVQFQTANSQGIVQILAGPGAESVD